MRGDDSLEAAPHALVEGVVRFGARDHVPPLLGEDLLEHRVSGHRPGAELAALPFAEHDLAQLRDLEHRELAQIAELIETRKRMNATGESRAWV